MKYSGILGSLIAVTVLLTPPTFAQLVTDGNTATTLTPNGNITDVTTTTVSGVNAFNSFSQFDVANGQTVNLHLPGATNNLINIINDATPSQINGIVNSIKNNEIGGNLFLANPNGIVVGSTGVINVGSLTAVTSTQTFVDNFFDAPGTPNAASVTALLNGTVPKSSNDITINGTINALDAVKLDAGSVVTYRATVNSGNSARQGVFDIQDVLNIGTATDASQIVAGAGTINIKTTGGVEAIVTYINGSSIDINADYFNLNGYKLTSSGDIIINVKRYAITHLFDSFEAGNDLIINSQNSIGFQPGITTAGRDIILSSNNNIWSGGNLTAGRDIIFSSNTTIEQFESLAAGRDIKLSANQQKNFS